MVVRADGCATCAGRRNEEEAGRVHELHDKDAMMVMEMMMWGLWVGDSYAVKGCGAR